MINLTVILPYFCYYCSMVTSIYKLFENFATGVVIHNANTEIIYSNQAALNILGLSIDQIQGKPATDPFWRFIREDGSNMPLEEFPVYQVLTSRKMLIGLVVGVIRADLDYPVWGLCNGHPEMDDEGNVAKVVLSFTDITALKKTENKLHKSELHYRTIIETAEEGIWTVDAESRTTFVNKKMASMLGYTCEEFIGKSMYYFLEGSRGDCPREHKKAQEWSCR
jgi:PAS domain-containing protein